MNFAKKVLIFCSSSTRRFVVRIFPATIIRDLINKAHFVDSSVQNISDERLRELFSFYRFLESEKARFLEHHMLFSVDELLYSQYYWFVLFRGLYNEIHGYDAGIEQQGFQMIENIVNSLESEIDWEIIEGIENGSLVAEL